MTWINASDVFPGFNRTFMTACPGTGTAEPLLKSAAVELLIVGDRVRIVAAERGLIFGFRQPRQEEITGEIIEFSAGSISVAGLRQAQTELQLCHEPLELCYEPLAKTWRG